MAGIDDLLARSSGAQGMMQGPMGAASPEAMPDEPPVDSGADLEGALAALDAAIAGLPPEKQEEIRTHANAIREIAGGGDAGVAQVVPPPAGGEEPKMEMPA